MGRMDSTEPQCLYKVAHTLPYLTLLHTIQVGTMKNIYIN